GQNGDGAFTHLQQNPVLRLHRDVRTGANADVLLHGGRLGVVVVFLDGFHDVVGGPPLRHVERVILLADGDLGFLLDRFRVRAVHTYQPVTVYGEAVVVLHGCIHVELAVDGDLCLALGVVDGDFVVAPAAW